ncbi:MAG TPA: hypothetical protein VFX61_08475 [Micromonosporaceae bacterium]|nr:hypothetical protein [Micromonosporaceae bacterium]
MDVGVALGRLLAGTVVAFSRLFVSDEDPSTSRNEFIEEIGLSGADVDELGLRHLARGMLWFTITVILFLVGIVVLFLVSVMVAHPPDIVFDVSAFAFFVPLFISLIHFLKLTVVYYTPERWWCKGGRVLRWGMLAELPDFVVAAAVAFLVLPL